MKMHLLFTLAMTLFEPLTCFASSFHIRPMSEFAQSADFVAYGRLTQIRPEYVVAEDGGKAIFTYATLEIKEVLKGKLPANTISIRHLGGSKDGTTLEVPSAPTFREGEDTVVLLGPMTEDQSYEVLGMELGKFGVKESQGKLILTGGLFSYSKPSREHDSHSHSQEAGDLSENLREWSLDELRNFLHSPTHTPTPLPNTEATTPMTDTLPASDSNEKDDSTSLGTSDPHIESDQNHFVQENGLTLLAALFAAIGFAYWIFRKR